MPSIAFSRRPWMTRKYFDAAMLIELSDQFDGARIPFSSKMTLPSAFLITESWVFQLTVSNAVLSRGTRRGMGIGSRPRRGDGLFAPSSETDWVRFFETAIQVHSSGRSTVRPAPLGPVVDPPIVLRSLPITGESTKRPPCGRVSREPDWPGARVSGPRTPVANPPEPR